ncbi:MAG: SPOR domain-containing protein [Campylobacterota bacterium]|nr:SPOR domain-containing protein [Campylobacterota bacterium]
MQDNNELNDIILNKGGSTSSNKKIILAVATLGVILIIVVMLMNSLTSNGTDNLPQAVLPPEPKMQVAQEEMQEPLFEEVEIIEEESSTDADLDLIAQKLKQESFEEEEVVVIETPVIETKKVLKPVRKKAPTPKVSKATAGSYYIQVGSFSKYKPNKKFLNSIKKLGYSYKYHKVSNLNKVLVGPFKTSNEAKKARRTLRSKVEPGAFLVKL